MESAFDKTYLWGFTTMSVDVQTPVYMLSVMKCLWRQLTMTSSEGVSWVVKSEMGLSFIYGSINVTRMVDCE